MTNVTAELVGEVCNQYSQDGLIFRLLKLDPEARHVELGLEFEDVECMDCVMPAAYLERLIAASLTQRVDGAVGVTLRDPRTGAARGNGAASGTNGRVVVLDPTTTAGAGDVSAGRDAGSLRGKKVLFRIDVLWESWDWVVDEWSRMLRDAGVEVRTWRRSQGTWGTEGERLQREYEALIKSSDALISGLGNCGSCSAATVSDALSGLYADVPTLTIVTSHFFTLSRVLAEDSGRPGLRIFELPYPLSQRPESEVRAIARNHFPQMLAALGATV